MELHADDVVSPDRRSNARAGVIGRREEVALVLRPRGKRVNEVKRRSGRRLCKHRVRPAIVVGARRRRDRRPAYMRNLTKRAGIDLDDPARNEAQSRKAAELLADEIVIGELRAYTPGLS